MAQLLSMRSLIGIALICAASPFPQGSDLTAGGHGLAYLVPAPGLTAKGIVPSSGRASASSIRRRTTSALRHFRESATVVHMTPFRDGQGGSAGGGSGDAGGGGAGAFDKKAEEAVDNYGAENSEMSVELVAEDIVDGKVRRLPTLAPALHCLAWSLSLSPRHTRSRFLAHGWTRQWRVAGVSHPQMRTRRRSSWLKS
jgi:hypothetical protein